MSPLFKRSLFIILIFIVGVSIYFQFAKPHPPVFKGLAHILIKPIGKEGAEVCADIIFHNPNSISAQLGKLDVVILLNNSPIGELHESFSAHISRGEEYHYPCCIRFLPSSVNMTKPIAIRIDGTAGSSVLMLNYTIGVHGEGVVE